MMPCKFRARLRERRGILPFSPLVQFLELSRRSLCASQSSVRLRPHASMECHLIKCVERATHSRAV